MGRPKRAAASKAEGFLRNLALAGAVPSGSNEEDTKNSNPTCAGGAAGAADGPDASPPSAGAESIDSSTSDAEAKVPSAGGSGGGSDAEGSGGGSSAGNTRALTKRKRSNGGSGIAIIGAARDAKKKKAKTTAGDRPRKSSGRGGGRGGGHGRGQPSMKPRPAATSASIAKVLDRLNGWGVKVRAPAHPSMDDLWKGVDVVLRNLPETSGLTVEALVGYARSRRNSRSALAPASVAGGGCAGGGSGGAGCSCGKAKQTVSVVEFFATF